MGKKLKMIISLGFVLIFVLVCISGPFHEADGNVRPLFGEAKLQLSGGTFPLDTKELKLALQPGETEYLSYFTSLVTADFTGSSDYAEIEAWAQANPQVYVKYTLTLPDGSTVDREATHVDLSGMSGADAAAAAELVSQLPRIEKLSLGQVGGDSALTLSDLSALRAALPEAKFEFSLDLLGQSVSPDVKSLDLSSLSHEQVGDAAAVLSCLTELKTLELGSQRSGADALTWEDVAALAAACPQADIGYSFELYGQQLSLSAEKLDFNHTPISDEGAVIRQILPLMKNCTYLDMDYCGVSNEAMATIRDENPDVKVVWRIWFGTNYSVRTDTERILASKPTVGGMLYDASVLQYCTDIKYLDIGHNEELYDLSFVSSMKDLEVLIIAMTAITDLSPLADCPKLEYLEINTTDVTDLSPLANATALRHLNLGNCEKLTDISPIMGLTEMDRLWLGSGTPIPQEQIDAFKAAAPGCDVYITGADPHEMWRYTQYDPDIPKYYWTERHELLREQLGYNYQEYSFYWLDPLCGDEAPAEYKGMFGREVYSLS